MTVRRVVRAAFAAAVGAAALCSGRVLSQATERELEGRGAALIDWTRAKQARERGDAVALRDELFMEVRTVPSLA